MDMELNVNQAQEIQHRSADKSTDREEAPRIGQLEGLPVPIVVYPEAEDSGWIHHVPRESQPVDDEVGALAEVVSQLQRSYWKALNEQATINESVKAELSRLQELVEGLRRNPYRNINAEIKRGFEYPGSWLSDVSWTFIVLWFRRAQTNVILVLRAMHNAAWFRIACLILASFLLLHVFRGAFTSSTPLPGQRNKVGMSWGYGDDY
ncbi:hypothetical protein K439DRAFT_1624737 [Ramaria rubella]|nr:hypothetical protein K439DRAFT_1624737 [Ramaria rubella]